MKDILYAAVVVINYVSLFYVLAISTIYLIQLISATMGLREYSRSLKYSDYSRYTFSDNMVPISVLVPAYNESATIVDNTRNLLSLDFGNYEVIVVNDGSKDNTLDLLKDAFRLIQIDQPYKRSIPTQQIRALYRSAEYPNLVVVDKENGGKADALNGIGHRAIEEHQLLVEGVDTLIDGARGGIVVTGDMVHDELALHACIAHR